MKTFLRLTCLYPMDYRFRFEREMLAALGASSLECRQRGKSHYARFVLKESLGLVRGAALEWIVKLVTDRSIRSLHLPDPRMMHLPWLSRRPRLDLLERLRCLSDTSR